MYFQFKVKELTRKSKMYKNIAFRMNTSQEWNRVTVTNIHNHFTNLIYLIFYQVSKNEEPTDCSVDALS